uniref:Uncharacterized protein n=1 Tax=Rhizochromulina marina TaxID=1034831 RepID=A0A7S2SST3_9STRA|mmetsp:Transcript_6661/g.19442  ORF Transcript_6661/g.19442 Transcript_6661/m.19442 type:complete len:432 (+) Transcript_6661:52-1347(+)|eukprot:CAMPEP_0118975088 /NCGR_PEP_ID=MMETSP1173-20130426/14350_1 /TAXON_ID=1034831 /ORGANISM="Rhizochromulina marina cf, Strain CCMP1243" /LENGTH=431 /DNA_ID=CAMNT_0006924915 /DNA_START=41 /DNA_END=1336 /DNA_ORIENTATION=+
MAAATEAPALSPDEPEAFSRAEVDGSSPEPALSTDTAKEEGPGASKGVPAMEAPAPAAPTAETETGRDDKEQEKEASPLPPGAQSRKAPPKRQVSRGMSLTNVFRRSSSKSDVSASEAPSPSPGTLKGGPRKAPPKRQLSRGNSLTNMYMGVFQRSNSKGDSGSLGSQSQKKTPKAAGMPPPRQGKPNLSRKATSGSKPKTTATSAKKTAAPPKVAQEDEPVTAPTSSSAETPAKPVSTVPQVKGDEAEDGAPHTPPAEEAKEGEPPSAVSSPPSHEEPTPEKAAVVASRVEAEEEPAKNEPTPSKEDAALTTQATSSTDAKPDLSPIATLVLFTVIVLALMALIWVLGKYLSHSPAGVEPSTIEGAIPKSQGSLGSAFKGNVRKLGGDLSTKVSENLDKVNDRLGKAASSFGNRIVGVGSRLSSLAQRAD